MEGTKRRTEELSIAEHENNLNAPYYFALRLHVSVFATILSLGYKQKHNCVQDSAGFKEDQTSKCTGIADNDKDDSKMMTISHWFR